MFNHLHGRNIFLSLNGIKCISICVQSLLSWHWLPQSLALFSLLSPPAQLLPPPGIYTYWLPWHFFSPGWAAPVLSTSPHRTDVPVPYSSLWTFNRLIPIWPYVCCSGESSTRPSTPKVSLQCWAEAKDHPPLNLMEMLFLMQSIILLGRVCCWHMVSLLSTRTHKSLSAKSLSSWWACLELFIPWWRTSHLPWLNITRLLLAHFSNLLRCLWMKAQTSGVPDFPSCFTWSVNLLREHSVPSSHRSMWNY